METPHIQNTSWVRRVVGVRVRLIPIVIFSATLLLSVKIVSFWETFQARFEISSAQAADGADKNTENQGNKKDAGSGPTAPDPSKPGEAKAETPPGFDPLDLSEAEIKVLQALSKRRDQLQLKEKELDSKESVLAAVESRLSSKLNELKGVQQKIEEALDREDEKQRTKLKRLVKIYETMKPKSAAHIMQDLHLELVVRIVEQMKEKSSSAILSKMDAEAARLITAKLAERKRLAQLLAEKETRMGDQSPTAQG